NECHSRHHKKRRSDQFFPRRPIIFSTSKKPSETKRCTPKKHIRGRKHRALLKARAIFCGTYQSAYFASARRNRLNDGVYAFRAFCGHSSTLIPASESQHAELIHRAL